MIAAACQCKVLVPMLNSERHPDLSVYTNKPPRGDETVWRDWIPALIVEIPGPDTEGRDYIHKREDYLNIGVKEYWIIDFERRQMLALRRVRDKWVEQTIRPPRLYRPRLFPGLAFDIKAVFAEAEKVADPDE